MRKSVLLIAALLLMACVAWLVQADEPTTEAAKAEPAEKAAQKVEQAFGYIGAKSCMACHKKEEKGAQYTKWLDSPHAQAYQSLLTEESKKICKEKGIAAAPEAAPQCLKCHVTGWDAKAELLGSKYDKTEGVSCESCHGPAAEWKKPHMKNVEEAMTLGMTKPDEAFCVTCHNEESPTYKPFKFAEKMAVIAHPNPKKKAEE